MFPTNKIDVREPHECSDICYNAIVSAASEQMGFNAVSICQLNPNYFAVGGQEPVGLVYDRRSLRRGSSEDISWSLDQFTWSWAPDPIKTQRKMVSSVAFCPASTELAVSYNKSSIFLMDPFLSTKDADQRAKYLKNSGTYSNEQNAFALIKESSTDYDLIYDHFVALATGHAPLARASPEWRYICGLEFYNAAAARLMRPGLPELRIISSLKEQIRKFLPDVKISSRIWMYAHLKAGMLTQARQIFEQAGFQANGPEETLLNQASSVHNWQLPPDSLKFVNIEATEEYKKLNELNSRHLRGFHHSYGAHLNELTVKDVSFVGKDGEYVATGSDQGYVFLYKRDSSGEVAILVV